MAMLLAFVPSQLGVMVLAVPLATRSSISDPEIGIVDRMPDVVFDDGLRISGNNSILAPPTA